MSSQLAPDITQGIYNTLCSGLSLSPSTFQMVQGAMPVSSNATSLYKLFDGVPPKSLSVLYTGNPLNTLSGNYLIMLDQAPPSGFIYTIASNNYQNTNNWLGNNNAPPGSMGGTPVYYPLYSDLLSQVQGGSSAVVYYDSATANTDVSKAWTTSTSNAGVYFWGTSSSSSTETINQKAATSRITVRITLNQYAYIPVQAGNWLTPGFFTNQYNNPSNWNGGQAQWDKIFGANGTLPRIDNQVLLTNGYTIQVTSYGNYSESDYSSIQSSSSTNVWPFYTSGSSSSATQTHTYNADQSITTTITCPVGNLQLLGMGVLAVKDAMNSGVSSAF